MFIFSVNTIKFKPQLHCMRQARITMSTNDINAGPIEQAIANALTEKLQPIHLEVVNESHMHNVPKGAETHFKVLVVSAKFESLPLIKVFQLNAFYFIMTGINFRLFFLFHS